MTQAATGRPLIEKLGTTARLKALLADYYRELQAASDSPHRRVAWCTSVGPAELLRALGFAVYFPENHGALLGASRRASALIPRASAAGYSPEVCSYLTSDIGAYLAGETPLTRAYGLPAVPRPDVLVYNTNQCREVQDWFAFYHRELGAPLLGVVTPRGVGEVTRDVVEQVAAQHRALARALEPIAGQRLDPERLRATVAASHRCSRLWERVLRMARHRPAPLTFFDATIHMAPAVVLRGDPRAEAYYTELLVELEGRRAAGRGAVAGEAHRLYWEGMPVWGRLREQAELLAGHRACVVASTYCNSWVFEALGESEPFEAMARAYTELFIVRAEEVKAAYLARMMADYEVDGIVYHDAKTCAANSNNRYGLPRRLSRELGLPHVVLAGDLCDLRLYSAEQARTQIEALIEQLVERQAARPAAGAGHAGQAR